MPQDDDNFAQAPVSIAEHKATKTSQGAAIWKPRDALIAALRDIDAGVIDPHTIIIVTASDDKEGTTQVGSFQAMPNTFYGVGILQAAINNFLER